MSDTKYDDLIFERSGSRTTITLNRPKVHNALSKKLSDEFNHAVREVRKDRECRILVIRGAGDTFCAGDDIKEFVDFTVDDGFWAAKLYQETVQIIEDMNAITIAAVDGVCTGGGLEITLVCDFVIATDRSRWGMPEIDWGITPGWGGTSRLPRFAGRRKAKEWNLIGALFDAETAARHDLVNRVCAPENLDAEVEALIEVMMEKAPLTVRRTKFVMNKGIDLPIAGALAFEVPIVPIAGWDGFEAFADPEARAKRRKLSKSFWQD